MSKKHYIAFAKRINALTDRQMAWDFANIVIDIAREDNPLFDADRFLAACGLLP